MTSNITVICIHGIYTFINIKMYFEKFEYTNKWTLLSIKGKCDKIYTSLTLRNLS